MLSYTDWEIDIHNEEIENWFESHDIPIRKDVQSVNFKFEYDQPDPKVGWQGGLDLTDVEINGKELRFNQIAPRFYDYLEEELAKALQRDAELADPEKVQIKYGYF